MRSFIHKDVVDIKICKDIIKYFEKNKKDHIKGRVNYDKVDPSVKDSIDLYILPNETKKPFVDYFKQLQICLNNYASNYPEIYNFLDPWGLVEHVNIQKYEPGGGFKRLHCERASIASSRRVLVFMTYLNDAKKAGTYFKHQDITTEAIAGDTYIWPAEWTHMHSGVVSNDIKYIITGWFSFSEKQ